MGFPTGRSSISEIPSDELEEDEEPDEDDTICSSLIVSSLFLF
jgi:hypothetical protein